MIKFKPPVLLWIMYKTLWYISCLSVSSCIGIIYFKKWSGFLVHHILLALSRISPRVRVRVSVSIVYRIATGGYSWIWPYYYLYMEYCYISIHSTDT